MPDAERARAALRNAELVIAQDAYHPTETTALAHVVLPAAQWPEKAGHDGQLRAPHRAHAQGVDPPGEARADWEIFAGRRRAGWASTASRGTTPPRSTTSSRR